MYGIILQRHSFPARRSTNSSYCRTCFSCIIVTTFLTFVSGQQHMEFSLIHTGNVQMRRNQGGILRDLMTDRGMLATLWVRTIGSTLFPTTETSSSVHRRWFGLPTQTQLYTAALDYAMVCYSLVKSWSKLKKTVPNEMSHLVCRFFCLIVIFNFYLIKKTISQL